MKAIKLIAIALITLLGSHAFIVPSSLLVYAEEVPSIERSKLMMLLTLTIIMTDIPLDLINRYEMFHTVYVYKNGSMTLIDQPYIPNEELKVYLDSAIKVREQMNKGQITRIENATGTYIYVNGTFTLGILHASEDSYSVWAGPLVTKSLSNSAIMYLRDVKSNFTNQIVSYQLVYLIANVSDTHKVYVATLAEKLDATCYAYVFTLAMYWFKDKTTFFGDWIIFPEGYESLSKYYRAIADILGYLHRNVYEKSSKEYRPTAYPQLAKYFNLLANNIPREIDLLLEKGYVVVMDFAIAIPLLCLALSIVTLIVMHYYGISPYPFSPGRFAIWAATRAIIWPLCWKVLPSPYFLVITIRYG